MELQLLRHATLRLNIGEIKLLVDPMLGEAGYMPPIQNSANQRPNPLVPLPILAADALAGIDAVLVTHTHRDHWDPAATELVPRRMPIICQPEDTPKFREWGFEDVRPIHTRAVYRDVTITRTAGQHGTGTIGAAMAPVSGYAFRSRSGESIYIAGDTIFCSEVSDALSKHKPKFTVVNCGGARFLEGDPITMTAEDVLLVLTAAPQTTAIAVHMEAINHCAVTREQLRNKLCEKNLCGRVLIPNDGELLTL